MLNKEKQKAFFSDLIEILKKDHFDENQIEILLDNIYAFNSSFNYKINDDELINTLLNIDYDSINKYILNSDILKIYFYGKGINTYDGYVELSNYPVLNKINVVIDEENWNIIVSSELKRISEEFSEKYGINIELIQLGRSGRHIVINNNIEDIQSLLYYSKDMVELYDKEENQFIENINNHKINF